MRIARPILLFVALASLCLWPQSFSAQRREYLNDKEMEQVREAQEPNQRAKLFLKFASERLQRFQQVLANPQLEASKEVSRSETLNDLLAGFTACLDDAAQALQLGRRPGALLTKGAQEMTKLAPGYLKTLEEFEKNAGPEFSAYQDTLDDAIEATRDALDEARKILAEQPPASERRRKR